MIAFARVIVAAGFLLWVGAASSDAKETPKALQRGLVAEKPADGPAVEVEGGFMVPYSETIPGTEATFDMIPVPGGEFLLGSPASEADRSEDEGPQVTVRVEPFWIGRCEVTWLEYHAYMDMYDAFKQFQTLSAEEKAAGDGDAAQEEARELIKNHAWHGDPEKDGLDIDAVTSPTPLYDPGATEMAGGEDDQPAVTMTQYAARQYTKWLSGIMGVEYRLPSEAEWEYAARAGTTTPYSFGADAAELGKYAWFDENSDYQTHSVGSKAPNPWGLYDMHGNVAEWTLDEYEEKRYAALAPGPKAAAEIVLWPTKVFPRVIRGGSWLDTADWLRSAARHKSEEKEWKLSDPNRPLSPWWYTEEPSMGVGMRVVRPLEAMSADEKKRVWEADDDDLISDVKARLKEGRGVLGISDQSLPAAVEAAEKLGEDK
jgi:formylglycine-generating enzyme required for sulfatase activity